MFQAEGTISTKAQQQGGQCGWSRVRREDRRYSREAMGAQTIWALEATAVITKPSH